MQVFSLSGLFILLTRHNLDYPEYYRNLYSLLDKDASVFAMQEKHRFLKLLDLSLRSNKLPRKTVSSFIKRIARLVVQFGQGSVQDCLFVLSLILNLLKRHPACKRLIHRKSKRQEVGRFMLSDPFDNSTGCLEETKVLQSSLWELLSFSKSHFSPLVRDYARIFTEDFYVKTALSKSSGFAQLSAPSELLACFSSFDVEKEGLKTKRVLEEVLNENGGRPLLGVKRLTRELISGRQEERMRVQARVDEEGHQAEDVDEEYFTE